MDEPIAFKCDICKREVALLAVDPTEKVQLISKQATSDEFFGNLETYHVESACNEHEIHVNVVVIDGDQRYRGHKYSAVKVTTELSPITRGNLRLLLSFGKDLSKIVTSTLEGQSIVFCGDGPTTNLWASTLQELFALSPYAISNWYISQEDFLGEYASKQLALTGEFILIDSSLLKLAKKILPKIPIVELEKRKVNRGKEANLTKKLVSKMLKLPPGQSDALLSLIDMQVEWLRRLLEELKEKLDPSIIETAACPVGNLSETVIIKSVLDQVLTQQVLGDLKARMREEEFDIVAAHLMREVPVLEELVHKQLKE